MKASLPDLKPLVLAVSVFGMVLDGAALHGQAVSPSSNGPRKIGYWDSALARVEDIDPEVYVMMKDADEAMTDMIRSAAIYAKADPSQSTVSGMIQQMLKDRAQNTILDVASDLNPAISPIKMLSDAVTKGVKACFDWNLRAQVDSYYKQYRQYLDTTKDPRTALARADLWMAEQLDSSAYRNRFESYQAMTTWKPLLHAWVVNTHRSFHPDLYKGVTLGAATPPVENQPPRNTSPTPRDVTPRPIDATPPGPRDVTPVPRDATPPRPTATPATPATLQTEVINYPSGRNYYNFTYYTKNGVQMKHGTYTSWYENGRISQQGENVDGLKEGVWTGYYENGNKNWVYVYRHGQIVSEEKWWPDGRPMK